MTLCGYAAMYCLVLDAYTVTRGWVGVNFVTNSVASFIDGPYEPSQAVKGIETLLWPHGLFSY